MSMKGAEKIRIFLHNKGTVIMVNFGTLGYEPGLYEKQSYFLDCEEFS